MKVSIQNIGNVNLDDNNFAVVPNTDVSQVEVFNDSNEVLTTEIIVLETKADAFDVFKEIEGKPQYDVKNLRAIQKKVLESQIAFYKENKQERRSLEEKLNNSYEQLDKYAEQESSTQDLVAKRDGVLAELENLPEKKLTEEEFDSIKQNKINERISRLLQKDIAAPSAQSIINDQKEAKYTWSEPIYSLALLQTFILILIYIFSYDIRVIAVGLIAFITQLLIATFTHEAEYNSIKLLAKFSQTSLQLNVKKENDLFEDQDGLVMFAFREALEEEVRELNKTLEKYSGISRATIEENVQNIEKQLEQAEAESFPPEVYLQKRRELDILEMEELVETQKIDSVIVVIHNEPETVSFARKQNNFLQDLEEIDAIYIATNPKFQI